MKRLFFVFLLSLTSISNASEIKELKVKKISQDLYASSDEKIFIKTRYCYESAYSYEDVILKIENKYGYNIGKLIFKNNKTCDVEKLYSESK